MFRRAFLIFQRSVTNYFVKTQYVPGVHQILLNYNGLSTGSSCIWNNQLRNNSRYINKNINKCIIPSAHYQEVKDLVNQPKKILIDVREPEEIKKTGRIPTSINIPLAQIPEVLTQDVHPEQKYAVDRAFKEYYERVKPDCNTEIVFYCSSGIRSRRAVQYALDMGYYNAKNYVGSWNDWKKRQDQEKPICNGEK